MALNFIESGERLDFTAVAPLTSGQPVLIGSMVGVSLHTVPVGSQAVIKFDGVFELPKVTGQAQAIGAKIYFDAAAGNFTTTATGNTLAGYVWRAAASADTSVRICLVR